MTTITTVPLAAPTLDKTSGWLKRYYLARFAFSALWVAAAFAIAAHVPAFAAVMLIGYPAWDAVANFVDAQQSGGFGPNKALLLNFVVSIATAFAVAVALGMSMHSVLFVLGIWAGFSGVLQLAAGVGRWKLAGAQWAMVLSGAQSVLAATHMIKAAHGAAPVGITDVAPYAAFGAFYFLVAAVALTVRDKRKAGAVKPSAPAGKRVRVGAGHAPPAQAS